MLFREKLTAKAIRLVGGPDTRPPAAWPFPTWKGAEIVHTNDEAPEPPKRRGPKAKRPTISGEEAPF